VSFTVGDLEALGGGPIFASCGGDMAASIEDHHRQWVQTAIVAGGQAARDDFARLLEGDPERSVPCHHFTSVRFSGCALTKHGAGGPEARRNPELGTGPVAPRPRSPGRRSDGVLAIGSFPSVW